MQCSLAQILICLNVRDTERDGQKKKKARQSIDNKHREYDTSAEFFQVRPYASLVDAFNAISGRTDVP